MKSVPTPGYRQARQAADYLRPHWATPPQVAVILGSGLKDVVLRLSEARRVAYRSIPHFPRLTVAGHAGTLHLGFWGKVPAAVLEGRAHLYEGYSPAQVVLPVRVLALAGVRVFVMTCAAGGIAPRATPGCLMFFSDHLNFQCANPLAGPYDKRWGTRFVDMTESYDPGLRADASRAAKALRLRHFEGVYASLLGPTYETPAEIRALRRLGADAVGMSTVPEVIAARQMGARVLAVAAITNRAAGLGPKALNHQEVLVVGRAASGNLVRLLDAILQQTAGWGP
jgi:purine-nucleoside phosphorylase